MSRLNESISSHGHSANNHPSEETASGGFNDSAQIGGQQSGALGFGIDIDEFMSHLQDASTRQPQDGTLGPFGVQYSAPLRFFLPLHYEPKYRYPLIVWLHNDGFNENQIDQLMPHISLRNYLAVGVRGNRAADSVGHRFDWHESPSAIELAHHRVIDAIDEAASDFSVHPDRVVLAGYRSGGTMALRIAMRDPDRFSAVVSFGGRMPRGGNVFGDLSRLQRRRLPMLWQWAEDDACYRPDSLKEDIHTAMTIKAKVDVLQYKGDDEMNTAALAELNQWIMSRVVSAAATSSVAADAHSSSPTQFSCN